jgi:hypothetical protein
VPIFPKCINAQQLYVQIPFTKLHANQTIHVESMDVNPYLFLHLVYYNESCAFGFALSVSGVKINVTDFHNAFLSHI